MGLHNILFNIFVITFLEIFCQIFLKNRGIKKPKENIAIFTKWLKYWVLRRFCDFSLIFMRKTGQKLYI